MSKRYLKSIHPDHLESEITITEHFDRRVCMNERSKESTVPEELQKIGVSKIQNYDNRKEFNLSLSDLSERNQIDVLYGNKDLIRKYFTDGDLVNINYINNQKTIIWSYIIVDSKPKRESDWCGMGPKEFTYETVYVLKNDIL